MKKALFVLPLVMSMLISAFIIYLIFGNGGKHLGHVFYLIPVSDFLASVYVKKYDYGEIFMMIPPVTEIIICIIYNNFDLGFDFGMIISGILLLLNIIGLLLCHCVRYLASKCKSKLSSKLLPKWIAVFLRQY